MRRYTLVYLTLGDDKGILSVLVQVEKCVTINMFTASNLKTKSKSSKKKKKTHKAQKNNNIYMY